MANQSDIKRKTVGDVVRFILFSTQTRKPIKKSDLSAIVRKANIAKPQDIIDSAKQKLSQGFGFDLIENNKSSFFVVIKSNDSEEERTLRGRILNSDENLREYRGLISVVLQLLILYGNKCEKSIFSHQLFDKLDTSIFGSPKQIIQDLKQQKWIAEEKETINGDERTYYKIGARANIETLSEWQYNAAFKLVNGVAPPDDDRALQRIIQEKANNNNHKNNNNNRRNNLSQRGRGRRGSRGRGRRRR